MGKGLTFLSLAVLLYASFACAQESSLQRKFDDLWEQTGVERPAGLKVYEMPVVGQRLVTVNNIVSNGIYDRDYGGSSNIMQQPPWDVPAGLRLSPKSQWYKISAASIPSKIGVWREDVQVFNGSNNQTQKRLSWSYPDKTVFVELLIRKLDGREFPFEARVRRKADGQWLDGETYRPYQTVLDLPFGSEKQTWWYSAHRLADFGVQKFENVQTYKLPKLSNLVKLPSPFKITRMVVTADHDSALVPRDYAGTLAQNCMTCHQRAGSPNGYAMTAIAGSDSIFSHTPFKTRNVNSDSFPEIDTAIATYFGDRR